MLTGVGLCPLVLGEYELGLTQPRVDWQSGCVVVWFRGRWCQLRVN